MVPFKFQLNSLIFTAVFSRPARQAPRTACPKNENAPRKFRNSVSSAALKIAVDFVSQMEKEHAPAGAGVPEMTLSSCSELDFVAYNDSKDDYLVMASIEAPFFEQTKRFVQTACSSLFSAVTTI